MYWHFYNYVSPSKNEKVERPSVHHKKCHNKALDRCDLQKRKKHKTEAGIKDKKSV